MVNLDKLGEINPDSDGTVGAIAVRGDSDAIDALPDTVDGVIVGSSTQLIEGLPGYQEQRGTLLLIQVFLVVIAAGIIAAFFFILTLQKMPELGVMKALGATTWVLAKALIIQALVLGVVGILVGISAGCIMQIIAEGLVPYQVQWEQMALYGSILLIVAIVGTMLSLVRIARVDPLDAINKAN
jgi:putative ABC transport system permease protein